ncbi:hypothetical protein JRG66_04405 [Salinimicrobium tongyeongense]|jgi:hypothetical protein|uniref:Uncharacterized protein n=1 Tax=Salinimicrobium tongyeongense TaxID=2809707 RepID=A0ABY6NT77_9FLAO|nr:hypothetical protein [Salinimicrobium tongyeongense]UZH56114.1 hypothetical protein JRG66_04405 [Salinimicrobium tongyeongense]
MEPERFEKNLKKLLDGREIRPSASGWEKLEQRLEHKKKKRPYLLWISAVAAVATFFFVVETYFNTPFTSEEPQLVEEKPAPPVLEEKTLEPEMIQIAAAEENEKAEEEEKASEETPVKNAIFEAPVAMVSEAESEVASGNFSEVTEEKKPLKEIYPAEANVEVAVNENRAAVSDNEVEALLLLATAELKADTVFTVNSKDLLYQVEYELEQSFRQKVFEVVKEGISRAKTAVANRDF